MNNQSAIHYLAQGWQLAFRPGLRRFVLIPLLLNLVLFGAGFWLLIHQLEQLSQRLLQWLPTWMDWLNWLLWPLALVTILLVFGFTFGLVANWIAAPFNGLLAEQVERQLTGQAPPDSSLWSLIKDVPRILRREWLKTKLLLPKLIGCLLLFLIPLVGQTVAPVLWFLLGSWMAAVQYCDYPFDNHKVPFQQMLQALRERRWTTLLFGALIMLLTSIPVINLLIMPVAVCAATAYWVDNFRTR